MDKILLNLEQNVLENNNKKEIIIENKNTISEILFYNYSQMNYFNLLITCYTYSCLQILIHYESPK